MLKLRFSIILYVVVSINVFSQENNDDAPIKLVEVTSKQLNQNSEAVLISNVNYIDVINGKIKKGSVLIADGQIQKIARKITPEAQTVTIDGSGKWLIPGLVDAHIHLFQSGGLYTRPDAIDLTKYRDYDTEREWLKSNSSDILKRYLRCGITTVIDVGGPLYNFKIRDLLLDKGQYPNLFLTGPLISTYQPDAFKIDDAPIIKVNSEAEAKQLVQKQLPHKPDFIKIWYIARNNQEADDNLSIIKAIIEESHTHNLRVAVHATQLHTAKLAVQAGADILVHSVGEPIDKAFIDLLKKFNTTYIPTLIVGKKYLEVFGQETNVSTLDFDWGNPFPVGSVFDTEHLVENETVKRYKGFAAIRKPSTLKEDSIQKKNLKLLLDQGISIATGTDAGNIGTFHGTSYFEEIDNMLASGITTMEVLKASTINGAKTLGKEKEFGSIEVGKMADMVLLNKNPIEDISALKEIDFVIKGGNAFKAENIIEDSPEVLVQRQLNAYNAGDIDSFLYPYSEDIEIYNFPNTLQSKGKGKIKPGYAAMFEKYPDLHCELLNRTILGNTVIDHEKITGIAPNGESFQAIAIYKVENGKIAKVYFIR